MSAHGLAQPPRGTRPHQDDAPSDLDVPHGRRRHASFRRWLLHKPRAGSLKPF